MRILLFLGLITGFHSVNGQFINGDFEQWDSITMFGQPYIDPADWETNNTNDIFGLANTPVTRGVDTTGYFAKIESKDRGIDALLPGWMKQTINIENLTQIAYNYKCDYIFQSGACVVNLYQGNTNHLIYTDSIFEVDSVFESKTIDILPEWKLFNDSITIEFVAKGNLDDFDEMEDGYSVFLIDKVNASYISSLDDNRFGKDFTLFPNPSTGIVTFDINRNDQQYQIEIYSIDGILINSLKGMGQFKAHFHSDGIYYAVCVIESEVYIKAFVISR